MPSNRLSQNEKGYFRGAEYVLYEFLELWTNILPARQHGQFQTFKKFRDSAKSYFILKGALTKHLMREGGVKRAQIIDVLNGQPLSLKSASSSVGI